MVPSDNTWRRYNLPTVRPPDEVRITTVAALGRSNQTDVSTDIPEGVERLPDGQHGTVVSLRRALTLQPRPQKRTGYIRTTSTRRCPIYSVALLQPYTEAAAGGRTRWRNHVLHAQQ